MIVETQSWTYLGLGSQAVGAIYPNVLGHHRTLLVEPHVFHELEMVSAIGFWWQGKTFIRTHVRGIRYHG